MSLIVSAEYLYNDSDNHDKVYNVAIKDTLSKYIVIAEWGARLGVLKQQEKYTGTSLTSARIIFNDLIKEKKAKGYRVVSQSASTRTSLTNIPQDTTKPVKPTKPKEPEKYNPNPMPERRLDF